MINSLNISLTGLNDAMLRLDATAHNIASATVEPPVEINTVVSQPQPEGRGVKTLVGREESVFGVDLVTEAVHLKLGEFAFKANAAAVKVADSVMGTLLDVVSTPHDSHEDS